MKKQTLMIVGLLACAVLFALTTDGFAYERYIDGCNSCHGSFLSTTVDKHGSTWPSNLHNVHRNSMLNGVCGACHLGSPSSQNAYTFQSSGTGGLNLGCSGCHGNNYNGVILGVGLRKHHAGAGVSVCSGCHTDPAPRPENVKPPYYGLAGVNVKDPLNADGSENWSDDGQGLDNDGNGLYDQNDPAASTIAVTSPATGAAVPTGAAYPVAWTAKTGAASYKLKYSIDGGLTWLPLASGVTGTTTNWNVPSTLKKNTKARILVQALDASNTNLGKAKSGVFTIEVASVTAPAAGATVPQGTAGYLVTWTTNGTKNPVSSSKVMYTFDGGMTWKAAAGSGTSTSFNWNVPTVTKAKNARIKVVLKDAGGVTVGMAVSGIFQVQ
ncbi:MAG: hypothetical protein FIA94_10280 [Nitrospirae bacterium]|nr:hypothetical protein [Nitrospirota bacterium]